MNSSAHAYERPDAAPLVKYRDAQTAPKRGFVFGTVGLLYMDIIGSMSHCG